MYTVASQAISDSLHPSQSLINIFKEPPSNFAATQDPLYQRNSDNYVLLTDLAKAFEKINPREAQYPPASTKREAPVRKGLASLRLALCKQIVQHITPATLSFAESKSLSQLIQLCQKNLGLNIVLSCHTVALVIPYHVDLIDSNTVDMFLLLCSCKNVRASAKHQFLPLALTLLGWTLSVGERKSLRNRPAC